MAQHVGLPIPKPQDFFWHLGNRKNNEIVALQGSWNQLKLTLSLEKSAISFSRAVLAKGCERLSHLFRAAGTLVLNSVSCYTADQWQVPVAVIHSQAQIEYWQLSWTFWYRVQIIVGIWKLVHQHFWSFRIRWTSVRQCWLAPWMITSTS